MRAEKNLPWTILFLLVLAPSSAALADSGKASAFADTRLELGRPLISHYDPQAYQGHPQNWSIVQGKDGRIYTGTNDNIHEYDGRRWRQIEDAPNTTIRSMDPSPDGRIYIGAQGEIGYLEPDDYGRMAYHGLNDELPDAVDDLGDVWRTHVTEEGVYFSTFDVLIRYSESEVETWRHDNGFHFAHAVGDRLFVLVPGKGLKELRADELETVPGGEVLAEARVYAMEALPDQDGMLIATGSEGFYLWQDDEIVPWTTDADQHLEEEFLYHATVLSDGRVLAATVTDGLFLLDGQGRWLSHVNRENGLPVNEVNFVYEDSSGGVWLAQDLGLSRLEWHHPVTVFDDENGPAGTVLETQRHDGVLFAGTTRGLFYLEPGPMPQWQPVGDIETEVWGLGSQDDRLFAASHRGVYEIHGDEATTIHELSHPAASLLPSQDHARRLYLTTRDGELLGLQEAEGEWGLLGTVEDLPSTMTRSVFSDAGDIWLGSEHAGLIRVVMDEATFPDDVQVKPYGRAEGLSTIENAFPFEISDDIYVRGQTGLHRFDSEQENFSVPAEFKDVFAHKSLQPTSPHKDAEDKIWMVLGEEGGDVHEFGHVSQDAGGEYRWQSDETFNSLENAYVHRMHVDEDGVFWFSGVNLWRYDSTLASDSTTSFDVLIRDVSDTRGASWLDRIGTDEGWVLPYSDNRIGFEIAVPRFDRGANPEFQVKLAGLEADWSGWTRDPVTEYVNLWEGEYEFKVRARDQYGNVSDVTAFEFSVLPPWYRSNLAYLAYVLLLGGTVWGGARWRFRHLEAQKRQLEQQVQKRTTQLEEAMVTDPLTGLRNRRYLEKFIDGELSDIERRYQDGQSQGGGGTKPEPHIFFIVDIDHFKEVNDQHGHGPGDRVLEQFGKILRATFRESDFLVRWGGEEFLAVARELPEDKVETLAERLRLAVERHDFDIGKDEPLKLSCSIGFAEYPPLANTPDALDWLKVVDLADHCLYAAKKTQRNAWVGIRLDDTQLSAEQLQALRDEPAELAKQAGTRILASLEDSVTLHWS